MTTADSSSCLWWLFWWWWCTQGSASKLLTTDTCSCSGHAVKWMAMEPLKSAPRSFDPCCAITFSSSCFSPFLPSSLLLPSLPAYFSGFIRRAVIYEEQSIYIFFPLSTILCSFTSFHCKAWLHSLGFTSPSLTVIMVISSNYRLIHSLYTHTTFYVYPPKYCRCRWWKWNQSSALKATLERGEWPKNMEASAEQTATSAQETHRKLIRCCSEEAPKHLLCNCCFPCWLPSAIALANWFMALLPASFLFLSFYTPFHSLTLTCSPFRTLLALWKGLQSNSASYSYSSYSSPVN